MCNLTELTRKDVDFKWGAYEDQAFKALKAAGANSILTTYPDSNRPFIHFPDASQKYVCGGLLCQEQDGVMVTVGCHSKKWDSCGISISCGGARTRSWVQRHAPF